MMCSSHSLLSDQAYILNIELSLNLKERITLHSSEPTGTRQGRGVLLHNQKLSQCPRSHKFSVNKMFLLILKIINKFNKLAALSFGYLIFITHLIFHCISLNWTEHRHGYM